MLEVQFLLINAHFTLNLFAALVSFAVAWLYFDAWLGRHDIKESTKSIGFALVSLSFVAQAVTVEQSVLENPFFGTEAILYVTAISRITGYIVLIIGQLIDPLQPLPSYRFKKASAAMIFGLPVISSLTFTFPVLAAITGYLYVRRATVGLEYHLRAIGYSFFVLSIAEVLSLASLFRDTSNPSLSSFVASFGPVWITQLIVTTISAVILGRWVWSYLIKRLETQLFMIFTTSTLVIFLATAIFFTSVSLANLRRDILANLEVSVQVLQFTIDSKRAEMLSDAEVIAQNPEIINATNDEDTSALTDITTKTLLAKNHSNLIVVSSTGKILSRAEDPEKTSGSLSDDPLIRKALDGTSATGNVTTEGVLAPNVSIRAAVPILDDGEIVGAAMTGSLIDNAFLDGLKEATTLDASVYGDNVRSATTFISPDGKSRWIGIKEETEEIKKTVLTDGGKFIGAVNILNTPYLSAFSPLKDTNENPVGMLFVGRPEVSTIQSAGELIEQTFLVTAGLLLASIIPSYFISKYIIDQITA